MTTTLSGPMFALPEDEFRSSVHKKEGAHYNVYRAKSEDAGMAFLREWFPDAKASEFGFVVFSTSGVHGTYTKIEDVEKSCAKYGFDGFADEQWPEAKDYHGECITFLVVEPRIVSTTYGNARVRSQDDIDFLKELQRTSWDAVQRLGKSK